MCHRRCPADRNRVAGSVGSRQIEFVIAVKVAGHDGYGNCPSRVLHWRLKSPVAIAKQNCNLVGSSRDRQVNPVVAVEVTRNNCLGTISDRISDSGLKGSSPCLKE